MSLFPVVTGTLLARAINSRRGQISLVQKIVKNTVNNMSNDIDSSYIAALQERVNNLGLHGAKVTIMPHNPFPFYIALEAGEYDAHDPYGCGATFDSAVANLKAKLPDRKRQAERCRNKAAELLAEAAKLEGQP